ncbi:MAG: MFS transporter, partial [Eggerthellaceae bacterium]|nr:MFS transporter [Eggerthellaceae bacterium]
GLGRFFELSALPGALPMVVLSPAFGFGIFFVGLYGTSLGVANPGLFYTLSALSMIAVRLKSKSFMDRVAPIKICTASTACGLAGFLLLFVAGSSDLAYYAAGILYGVCLGVSMPLNQAVAVKNTPAERWGAANALYLLASDVGIGVSSIVWGLVNDAAGFPATICCVMGCILAAWVVAWFSYPSTRREHKKA